MKKSDRLVPGLSLPLLLQGLVRLGLDRQAVATSIGGAPADPSAMIPVQKYIDFWRIGGELFGQPGLATQIGSTIPFGHFGGMDYLISTSETVGEACQMVVSYLSIVTTSVVAEHIAYPDARHGIRVRGAPGMEEWIPFESLEFTLAVLAGRLRHATGDGSGMTRTALRSAQPPRDEVRRRFWGEDLEYGAAHAEMWFDAASWSMPCVPANPALHAALEQMARQLRVDQSGLDPFGQMLQPTLRKALAEGKADVDSVASLLGLSPRTMQRRLSQTGQSFAKLLEDFRYEEAKRLLGNAAVSIEEVSVRLGYAEQSSFNRAFRKWSGTTPRGWRQDSLQE